MLPTSLQNLLDPAVLFFFLGCTIALLRSNLSIPPAVASFISLYLLLSLGFKGGVALASSPITPAVILAIASGMALALIVPILAFIYLRRQLSPYDAAATAAAYGSVSAVTFITATQFLDRQGIAFDGTMTVVMVLMETPAILMAITFAHRARQQLTPSLSNPSWLSILREAMTDGPHLLLIGSLIIGILVGPEGKAVMDPFTGEIFKGFLAFFLLEMGLNVVHRGREHSQGFIKTLGFGLVMPLISASLALGIALLINMEYGNSLLLMVLAASASYIVVPAIAKHAIPEANPSIYFGSALVITFPFNIIIGIPLYHAVLQFVMR